MTLHVEDVPTPPVSGRCQEGMHMHTNQCWRNGWVAGYQAGHDAGCNESAFRVELAEAHKTIALLEEHIAELTAEKPLSTPADWDDASTTND